MRLEITIPKDEWAEVLGELLPLKIRLDEDPAKDRWLWLGPFTSFDLVPDRGLRVACPAELHWSTAIGDVPLHLNELRVMFSPLVADREGRSLALVLFIEETDFARLPEIVDRGVMKGLNEALAKYDLSWNFSRAFTRSVKVPKPIELVSAVSLATGDASLLTDVDAVRLQVSIGMQFERTG